ncbi:MAG: glycosyltransferase [archaeon YNP-WB-062]|jgi:glycosyltransferase involved in cell wall biosynthesis|nr:glycosyltransferase [Candidatus Culexarchaeum yellowstonense]
MKCNDKEDVLSVIVLSKNNGYTIEATLKSILKAEVPDKCKIEVIVVDARSTDNTPKILAKFKDKIKVVYDEGRGIGIARNIGVLSSKGKYICFVDADCIVSRDHFKKILQAFNEGGDVLDVNSRFPLNYIKQLKLPKLSKIELSIWRVGRVGEERNWKNMCFAGGAFISFRREVFLKVGGFWDFPPYGADDLDFSYRASKLGYKVRKVNVEKSLMLPRVALRDLLKQQKGWGSGYAYFIGKYRGDACVWKCYNYSKIIYKIFGKYTWFYIILRLISAPIGALNLTFKLREIEAFPYWIVRRYAFIYGLLKNFKHAFSYFSIK